MGPIKETDLEEPLRKVLETDLGKVLLRQDNPNPWLVLNTARGGEPAGQWSQPDLVLACVRRYRSRAFPELELFGFELKTEQSFDISSVHQALAHTRFLHRSHVVVHCPDDESWEHKLTETRYHAQKYGIGLIRLKAATANSDYEIALESERFDPSPNFVDCFLEDRLSDLLDWVSGQFGKEH